MAESVRTSRMRRVIALMTWVSLLLTAFFMADARRSGIWPLQTPPLVAFTLSIFSAFIGVFAWLLFNPGRRNAIDVPRPKKTRWPGRISGVGYGAWRGLLTRSRVRLRGKAGLAWRRRRTSSLVLGDHPRAEPLHRLNVAPHPIFTCFMPSATGVLDDYVESWFLTGDDAPPTPDFDLDDVINLTESTERLDPPDREATTVL